MDEKSGSDGAKNGAPCAEEGQLEESETYICSVCGGQMLNARCELAVDNTIDAKDIYRYCSCCGRQVLASSNFEHYRNLGRDSIEI